MRGGKGLRLVCAITSALAVASVVLPIKAEAKSHTNVGIVFGFGAPVYAAPYYAPPPVYYAPPPIYGAPPPAYYYPPAIVAPPPPPAYYVPPGYPGYDVPRPAYYGRPAYGWDDD